MRPAAATARARSSQGRRAAFRGRVRLEVTEIEELPGGRALVLGLGELDATSGTRHAQQIVWIVTVRDGLLASSVGYSDVASARRAALDAAGS